jgi:hypothetical protein
MTHLILAAAAVLSLAAADGELTWQFDQAEQGRLPEGWLVPEPAGERGRWSVVPTDAGRKGHGALAQLADSGPNPQFNLCIAEDTRFRDLDLTVEVRAVAGKLDQGGGPVWRLQDENNYYIARWNPLETNFRVYKVVDGKRTQLATADVPADPAAWHTIRIVQRGDRIRCDFDGQTLLEAEDAAFPHSGRIGLWTKADAVTQFDNLSVKRPETP